MGDLSDVTTAHADYKKAAPRWQKCEDAAAGEDAIKARAIDYLPKPNPGDLSHENIERYKHYLTRAVYYNATGRTLQGLLGLVFSEPPVVTLPSAMAFAETDVSGSGLPLVQHAQATLSELLKTGRGGLFVDYPTVIGPVSLADQQAGDVRPTVTFYPAIQIINWRTKRKAGKTVLSMVVLKEEVEQDDPSGFGGDCIVQYRVLSLPDTGYQVDIWQQRKAADGLKMEWQIIETYLPTQGASGAAWNEIPFQFVGAQNNDWNIDDAPLHDIAVLNVAHFRNSADYEDSVYLTGQPQVWIAGLTEEWRDTLIKSGIYFGARSAMPLPVGGSAGMFQAQPNTLSKEAMDAKESQMAALGARLIQAPTSIKTATQVDSEDAIAHSVLALCCSNLNSAYTQVLVWFGVFAKIAGKPSLTVPTDFSSYVLDAQTLLALMQGVQTGNIPQTDLWARLRAAGIIDAKKSDDDIREEIESQMPTSGPDGLADPNEQAVLPSAGPAATDAKPADGATA